MVTTYVKKKYVKTCERGLTIVKKGNFPKLMYRRNKIKYQ